MDEQTQRQPRNPFHTPSPSPPPYNGEPSSEATTSTDTKVDPYAYNGLPSPTSPSNEVTTQTIESFRLDTTSLNIKKLYVYPVSSAVTYSKQSTYALREYISDITTRKDARLASNAAYISTPFKRTSPSCFVVDGEGKRVGEIIYKELGGSHYIRLGDDESITMKKLKAFRLARGFTYQGRCYEWHRPMWRQNTLVLYLVDEAQRAETVEDGVGVDGDVGADGYAQIPGNDRDDAESIVRYHARADEVDQKKGKVVGLMKKQGPSSSFFETSARVLTVDANLIDERVAFLTVMVLWQSVRVEKRGQGNCVLYWSSS